MKLMIIGILLGLSSSILLYGPQDSETKPENTAAQEIRLGNFSVSLAVKDLQASLDFYQKLGFKQIGGNVKQRWVILQNETATIGLFQGVLEKNTLTFNPGWDRNSQTLDDFDDVRMIQQELLKRGIEIATRADQAGDGPAFLMINDPDGNPILIDQHVARKK